MSEEVGNVSIYYFSDIDVIEYWEFAVVARSLTEARTKIRVTHGNDMGDRIDKCCVKICSIDAVVESYGFDSHMTVIEPKEKK